MQLDFRLAVILLDSVLIGQRTTVQLQIKLTAVGCRGVADCSSFCIKSPTRTCSARGQPSVSRQRRAAQSSQTAGRRRRRQSRRRAAAYWKHAFGAPRRLFTFHRMMIDALCIRPDMCFIEVGKHLRAVNSLPIKRIIWEGVGIIPLNFGCEKIIHTAAFIICGIAAL